MLLKLVTGNGKSRMENGKRGKGNGEREMRNAEQGTGSGCTAVTRLIIQNGGPIEGKETIWGKCEEVLRL